MSARAEPLLDLRGLRVGFARGAGCVWPVDGLDLELERGEILALVGESGSGKSLACLALLDLLPRGARVEAQRMRFDGHELLQLGAAERARLRGGRIAIVFQDPLSALNPYLRITRQLGEVLELHRGLAGRAARAALIAALEEVGLGEPEALLAAYPHELSGGQRQRVCLAMALLGRPKLLLADEPTTALDPGLQRQVLELVRSLARAHGTAVLLVTHALGLAAAHADRVQVAYAGRAAERAPARELFAAPRHPYTRGLLESAPRLSAPLARRLPAIPGQIPAAHERSAGCAFAPRCARAEADCAALPRFEPLAGAPERWLACFHPEPDSRAARELRA